jgi:hypothetical protein
MENQAQADRRQTIAEIDVGVMFSKIASAWRESAQMRGQKVFGQGVVENNYVWQ